MDEKIFATSACHFLFIKMTAGSAQVKVLPVLGTKNRRNREKMA